MNMKYADGGRRRAMRRQQRQTRKAQNRFERDSRREARRAMREGRDVESPLRDEPMFGDGGMYYGAGGKLKMVEKNGEKVPFFLAEHGVRVSPTGPMLQGDERMTTPPRAMGADPNRAEQYYAEKGTAAELRKMGRENRRAANRAFRQLPKDDKYYVPEPSTVQNLLTGLETDRFNREDMVKKGFRQDTARMLGRNALLAALGLGVHEYGQTPSRVYAPIGSTGQTRPVDLNVLQRIGYMLGLGPY